MISTRPVTLRAISTGQSAPAQVATSRSSSSAVIMSSSAEAVMRAAPASSTSSIRVMSRRRVSIVTGVPSEALSGGSAAARVSSSSSLSYMTQCWGPGSRTASQRAIDPVPQPRSWMVAPPWVGR